MAVVEYSIEKEFRVKEGKNHSILKLRLIDLQVKRLEDAERKWPGSKDSMFYLGYIAPEQFVSYSCNGCGKTYDGVPPKHEVWIDLEKDKTLGNKIGTFSYRCECNNFIGYTTVVFEGDKPDVKYIVQDLSGEFVPITSEFVESFLEGAKEDITKLHNPHHNLHLAKKLSEKIGYSLGSQIKTIEDIYQKALKEDYIKNLESNLEELSEDVSMMHIDEHFGLTPIGIYERLEDFFKYIPTLDKIENEGVKEDMGRICSKLKEFDQRRIGQLNEKVKELQKGVDDYSSEIKRILDIEEKLGLHHE